MSAIFILIMFGITVLFLLFYSRKNARIASEFCSSDSDCKNGERCISNPEYDGKMQCFPNNQKFCDIFPFTNLQSCRLGDLESCTECLNNPAYTCVDVKKDKPYIFKQNGKTIYIPVSENGFGWCLPNMENKDIVCNEYTSDYVLSQTEDGGYEWICHCKYPNLFDHASGPESSCDLVNACRNGEFVVPRPDNQKCSKDSDCGNDDKCLQLFNQTCGYSANNLPVQDVDCSKPDSNCYCHTKWEGKTATESNPLLGRCVCNGNLKFQCLKKASDFFEMNCVQGQCSGFQIDDKNNCNPRDCSSGGNCVCCKCPEGYIRCPDDIYNNPGLINYCKENGATCIPDPCKTEEAPNGKWDFNKRQCVCPDPNTVPYSDDQSPVGEVCVDLCGKHNPCGNRGTCYVPEGSLTALCCDCISPYTNDGDSTCSCSINNGTYEGGDPCWTDAQCSSGKCNCDRGYHSGKCVDQGTCSYDKLITSKCGTICTPSSNQSTSQTCNDGQTTCMSTETCCPSISGGYFCADSSGAQCCDDKINACPSSYPKCDTKKGGCFTNDGTGFLPFPKKTNKK